MNSTVRTISRLNQTTVSLKMQVSFKTKICNSLSLNKDRASIPTIIMMMIQIPIIVIDNMIFEILKFFILSNI